MNRYLTHIRALALPFLICACSSHQEYTMSKTELMDKIQGSWAAQTIGCAYGGPTEFRYQGQTIADSIPILWSDHQVKDFFDNQPGLYDDVYMDLTFLDVLHRLGKDAPVDSFALAFAHADYHLWHANQAARCNILRGIMPPESGHWLNNPHADDIDYQIEADYAGIMCPGLPNLASKYSDKIGHIMNYGDGYYGGVFVGAMYTQAFIMKDIPSIINKALQTIPAESNFHQCISDVIKWHSEYPDDWRQTWQLCQDNYAEEVGCPEGVHRPLDIDASINAAYIVIGLLYGEGDFGKTLEISTRCGQDSDCNPASAAGILGCMMGYSQIPEEWKAGLKDIEDRPFQFTNISLKKAYEYSFELALQNIEETGGRISGDQIKLRLEVPKAVPMEECFAGITPKELLPGNTIDQLGKIEFEGCGIVVCNWIQSPRPDYVAEVEVYLDDKLAKTVTSAANYHDRSQELCWFYDLEEGHHTMELKWLNPEEGIQVNCHNILVYTKKQSNEK
ncbi:MAG: ADP-ribosylglycohydrolase family protein [Bacteroidaceae bacterium]|nr:ADP-ribosylglycohydrolase family protein [Bacteroidaceae bacterium]